MQWTYHQGDILDVPADVLICSANTYLNLSGGVGGAFLLRYGSAMQEALHKYLAERSIRHVDRGTVIAMPSCNSPYLAVMHAVAVDGLYESTNEVLVAVLEESLRMAVKFGAKSVALTALATGYGRLPISEFGRALAQVARENFQLERVTIGLRKHEDIDELHHVFPQLS